MDQTQDKSEIIDTMEPNNFNLKNKKVIAISVIAFVAIAALTVYALVSQNSGQALNTSNNQADLSQTTNNTLSASQNTSTATISRPAESVTSTASVTKTETDSKEISYQFTYTDPVSTFKVSYPKNIGEIFINEIEQNSQELAFRNERDAATFTLQFFYTSTDNPLENLNDRVAINNPNHKNIYRANPANPAQEKDMSIFVYQTLKGQNIVCMGLASNADDISNYCMADFLILDNINAIAVPKCKSDGEVLAGSAATWCDNVMRNLKIERVK